MKQSEIIKNLLTNEWTPSYELIKVETQWGFLGSSGDRCARRLAENGEIESERRGKFVYFRRKKPVFGCSRDIHRARWGK